MNYANSAASAGSATNDSAGRNIANTYLVRANGFANGNLCLTKEGDTYPTLSFFSAGFRNHIMVLERGAVAEYGTHAELLAKGGIYAKLYEKQQLEKQLETE